MIRSAAFPLLFLFLVVLLHLQTELVQSACCNSNYWTKRCGDGTIGTPCCGYRKCNFFCCACECRGKREVGDQEEKDPFEKYDEDGDGRISLPEARKWLIAGGCGNPIVNLVGLSSQFSNLDSDNDGILDRQEIGG